MRIVLRALLGLLALFLFVMGAQFLVSPVATGAQFGLEALDLSGMSSLRSFNGALFLGLGLLLGLRLLNVELSGFLAVALFEAAVVVGRLFSMAFDGTTPQLWSAVTIEVVAVVALVTADRLLIDRGPVPPTERTHFTADYVNE